MKQNLVDYIKSLNPQKDQQQILIYGRRYRLWRGGEYLGVGIWTKDEFIGDSFQTPGNEVFVADKWELIL